jgi:hypothetical protein
MKLTPFTFRLMLLRILPLAFISGLRLQRVDEAACHVQLKYGYLTQNPFRSIYFAALAMAAEMCSGLPALLYLRRSKVNSSMLVTEMSSVYHKKAVGEITFKFEEVALLEAAIREAVDAPEGRTFDAVSKGFNAQGECVATFTVRWSFRKR